MKPGDIVVCNSSNTTGCSFSCIGRVIAYSCDTCRKQQGCDNSKYTRNLQRGYKDSIIIYAYFSFPETCCVVKKRDIKPAPVEQLLEEF